MIQHYLKTILRHINFQKGTTVTNVIGLTTGITCSLLIFFIIQFENSFDSYHKNADRIYRVETIKVKSNSTYPGTPTGVVSALRNEVRGVEKVVPIMKRNKLVSIQNDASNQKFEEAVFFTDNNLFDIFDFEWISGDPKSVLQKPNEVIISESYAQKFFNNENVLGKRITLESVHDLVVVGVLTDPPTNSDFSFDIIASYETLKTLNPDYNFNKWGGWSDSHQSYVLLSEDITEAQIESQFPKIIQKYKGTEALKERGHSLHPLNKVHYAYNFSGRSANAKLLRILSIVGIFLLLIACTNFINLVTAQALKRAKEVGVRKVFGSSRRQILTQFMLETSVISLLCVMLSLVIIYSAFPHFTNLLGIDIPIEFFLNLKAAIFLLILWLSTTVIAGFYPAVVIANQAPIGSMVKKATGQKSKLSVRSTLMIVQFGISLVLIISTLVITQQLQLFMNSSLGFNEDAIVTVNLPRKNNNQLSTIRQQLLTSPLIQQVSFSNNSASSENNYMTRLKYIIDNQAEEIKTQMKFVDEHFLNLYEIDLIAGEPLKEKDTVDEMLINQVMVNKMQLGSPEEALGRKFMLKDREYTVKAVIKDFHVNSLHQEIDPTALLVKPNLYYQANIKLNVSGLSMPVAEQAIKHIEKTWSETFPNFYLNYNFLDQTLQEVYHQEEQTAKIVKVATGIAILLSSLGLFGLAMFISSQRVKEIAVRKIMGASSRQVFFMLYKSYLKLIIVAVVCAIPIAWYYMQNWLQSFAYRVNIDAWIFLVGIASILLITLLTIGYQLIKTSLVNPAESLRD